MLVSICIPPLRNVKGLHYSTEGTNQYNFVGITDDFDGSLVELSLGGTIRGLHNNASASKRFFKIIYRNHNKYQLPLKRVSLHVLAKSFIMSANKFCLFRRPSFLCSKVMHCYTRCTRDRRILISRMFGAARHIISSMFAIIPPAVCKFICVAV